MCPPNPSTFTIPTASSLHRPRGNSQTPGQSPSGQDYIPDLITPHTTGHAPAPCPAASHPADFLPLSKPSSLSFRILIYVLPSACSPALLPCLHLAKSTPSFKSHYECHFLLELSGPTIPTNFSVAIRSPGHTLTGRVLLMAPGTGPPTQAGRATMVCSSSACSSP